MKFRKLISCLLVVMLLCAFAFSTFAEARERSPIFSATTLKIGYTFKDFARPSYATSVTVNVNKLTYANGGYYYFYAHTCDNSGTYTSVEEKVFSDGMTFDLNSTGTSLSYFNLRVDNASYKENQPTNNLEVEGSALAG